MITDRLPRKTADKEEYWRSDSMRAMLLPPAEPARSHAAQLKAALSQENRTAVQQAANALAAVVAAAFQVKAPSVRVLSARPKEVNGNYVYEMFGDYDPNTARIRLWMRTAERKQATSYGTLLSTLCHELCHHLDVVCLDFPSTFHTRGFYERAALLYHHIQGTPLRKLVWSEQPGGTFRINWASTMRPANR